MRTVRATTKRRAGRPALSPEGRKDTHATFRLDATLRDKLATAAAAGRRSISREIEARLELSFAPAIEAASEFMVRLTDGTGPNEYNFTLIRDESSQFHIMLDTLIATRRNHFLIALARFLDIALAAGRMTSRQQGECAALIREWLFWLENVEATIARISPQLVAGYQDERARQSAYEDGLARQRAREARRSNAGAVSRAASVKPTGDLDASRPAQSPRKRK